jgi:hypothetical protein
MITKSSLTTSQRGFLIWDVYSYNFLTLIRYSRYTEQGKLAGGKE